MPSPFVGFEGRARGQARPVEGDAFLQECVG